MGTGCSECCLPDLFWFQIIAIAWADTCNEMVDMLTRWCHETNCGESLGRQKFREGKLGGNWLFTNDSIFE